MPSAADIIKDYITELSRLQDWMIPIKETNVTIQVGLRIYCADRNKI